FEETALEELRALTKKNIIITLASRKNLLDKINEIYFSNNKALIRLNDSSQFIANTDSSQSLANKDFIDPIISSEKRLIKFLESSNVLNPSVISFLEEKSKELNKSYLDLFNEESLVHILSDLLGFPIADLSNIEVDKNLLKTIPSEFVIKNICLPINLNKKILNIAIFNPFQSETIINLEKLTGYSVKTLLSTKHEIYLAISSNYTDDINAFNANEYDLGDMVINEKDENDNQITVKEEKTSENLLEISHDDAPVVKMVNLVISKAIKDKASDIHVEPNETSVIIRNRVDGVLTEVLRFQKYIQNAFISRIKILSKLDITEKRIPQDGKIKLNFEGTDIDIRVSTLPTNFGETIVMRILDTSGIKKLTLEMLGFSKANKEVIETAINEPQGMILVTGPTGSGKSSTLYSFLKAIN
ncbi:MAG: GspE/PulE family protein, partial [Candidatus Sericytochromatia bacterium]